jgi:hypothetical protein
VVDKRKTWFLDFDGTLVEQRSHLDEKDYILEKTKLFFAEVVKENDFVIITTGREESHKSRIEHFMEKNNLKCDLIICGLPTGPRVLINDYKPDGSTAAHSLNVDRDKGILIEKIVSLLENQSKKESEN